MSRTILVCLDMSWQFLDNVICVHTCLEMPMVLSKPLLHSLGHNSQNAMQCNFFSNVMPFMPMLVLCDAKSIINGSIVLIGQDNWNKMWHDYFVNVMLLVPVPLSHDTDGTVNNTILFVRSKCSNHSPIWFGSERHWCKH